MKIKLVYGAFFVILSFFVYQFWLKKDDAKIKLRRTTVTKKLEDRLKHASVAKEFLRTQEKNRAGIDIDNLSKKVSAITKTQVSTNEQFKQFEIKSSKIKMNFSYLAGSSSSFRALNPGLDIKKVSADNSSWDKVKLPRDLNAIAKYRNGCNSGDTNQKNLVAILDGENLSSFSSKIEADSCIEQVVVTAK
jgi:hypothetical protein